MAKSPLQAQPGAGGRLSRGIPASTIQWGIATVVALCVLAAVAMTAATVTTVRLPRSDNRLFRAVNTPPGSQIRLKYLHSVEKTAVEGRFVIGKGSVLQAVQTRMTSVGTGLPNTLPGRTRREGDWIVVDEGFQEIPGFDFLLAPINRTRLVVRDTPIPVEDLASGSVIRLDVEKIRLGQWVLWRWFEVDWRKDRQ